MKRVQGRSLAVIIAEGEQSVNVLTSLVFSLTVYDLVTRYR